MNKEFCINCGSKVEYPLTKPKFCPNCGQPFNTSLGAIPTTGVQNEEPEYVSGKFDLNKLRQSVGAQMQGDKVSLDDLWKDPQASQYKPRPASSDPEGKELIRKVMEECKPHKEPIEIDA